MVMQSPALKDVLDLLTSAPADLKAQLKKIAVEKTAHLPWVPSPGGQTAALNSPAQELFTGGEPGGGKSSLLIGAAVTQHTNSIIFRREFPQIKGLEQEAARILGSRDGYNAQHHIWRIPGSKRVMEFGSVPHEWDVEKYQGRAHDFKGFDEITHFCLHPNTEVLTDRGWVAIARVSTDDRVLAMSSDRSARYERVTATHAFDYDGELICSRHRSVRYKVTPNHQMVVVPQRSEAWRFVEAAALPDYALYPFSLPWSGASLERVPLPPVSGRGIGSNANQATDIDPLDWAEFLGWYFSEGSCFETGPRSGPHISIRQTKRHAGLDALMARLPWRAKWYEGEGYIICSRQLFGILKPLGDRYQKRVPRWLLNADVGVLGAFWRAFVAGDGHIRENGSSIAIGLCNEGLRDDCQEIAAKLGHRSTAGDQALVGGYHVYRLHVHGKKDRVIWEAPAQRYRERYTGKVYCLTVEPSHTFLIRVDGRLMWTGNSQAQYRYLTLWLRSTIAGQRCRIICTGNPPQTAEGMWVIQHWKPWLDETYHDPALPGELRWAVPRSADDDSELFFASLEEAMAHVATLPESVLRVMRDSDGNIIPPRSRTYIPARMEDITELAQSGYRGVLAYASKGLRGLASGKFTSQLQDRPYQVIPTAWIVAAQERWKADGGKDLQMTAMAFDPAGGGKDAAVLAFRHGGWYAPLVVEKGKSTAETTVGVNNIFQHRRDGAPVVLDVGGGYASGIKLRLSDNAIAFIAFNGANSSSAKALESKLPFENMRAETWWRFREALDPDQPGGSIVALPPDADLRADLAAPCLLPLVLERRGVIQLESKEELRKRLGRSPDRGDAVVMCMSEGGRAIRRLVTQGGGNRALQTQTHHPNRDRINRYSRSGLRRQDRGSAGASSGGKDDEQGR